MKMKTSLFYIIFLFLLFSSCYNRNCKYSKNQFTDFKALKSNESMPDSVKLFFPSIACSECLVSSRTIIREFHKKDKVKLVIVPNGSIRDSKIIYSNELNEFSSVLLDSLKNYYQLIEEDPSYIWMYVYFKSCEFKIKVEGGLENEIIDYLEFL